jgi:hypothetical protein
MSFSIPGGSGGGGGATPDAPAVHAPNPEAGSASHPDAGHSFGDRLGSYFASKYPIAGGLANSVFGGGGAPQVQPAQAPLGNLPTGAEGQAPMADLVGPNAQPKSGGGGGLQAILSLIGL